MRPRELATLVVLSVIWGSAFALVKVVLEEAPALTLVAGRIVGGFLFLAALLVVQRRGLSLSKRSLTVYAVLGLGNVVWPFVFLTWGQERTDSSVAAILTSSMTLSTALLAHAWIQERLTLDRSAGLLVGFAGVFVLIGPDFSDLTKSNTVGQLAVLVGVLGYSFGTVFARRFLDKESDGTAVAAGQLLMAGAVMTPVALAADRPFDLDLSAKHVIAWLALGVVASGIAYPMYFWLVRSVSATQASMVSYLIPVTAVAVGALVLEEDLRATTFVGMALIIAGVWTVNGGWLWLGKRRRVTPTPMLGRIRDG